ncbi:MAG: hypothetical protein Q8O07_09985, partial [Chloroflexota bacterium]|nr:hypothetical protein [Chloroflexota bacterium]
LWTIQRILLGAPSDYAKEHYLGHLTDIDLREVVSLVPLLVFMVIIGVYPSFILNLINSTVTLLLGKL